MIPNQQTLQVQCRGCKAKVPVSAERARSQREVIVFCSRGCQSSYVAREGMKAQRENLERKLKEHND